LPVEPSREGKEEEEMNHYMDFDPYFIRERNERLLREVSTHRLQKRLREQHGPSGSRFGTFVRTATLPLLRGLGLAGR
jgi:hypothetical protein